jgi:microcin C transport system substrate-binding protein
VLALLESYRKVLDPTVFGGVYVPPMSGCLSQDPKRQAAQIFSDTGCKPARTLLTLPDGKHFESSFWISIMARSCYHAFSSRT